ncbi:MAG TPA: SCO family protein [Silvibacterium sp.]|nr:SCO family protein [Silvibacterium sp.]
MHRLATIRNIGSGLAMLALAFGGATGLRAQVSDYGQKQMGPNTDQPSPLLQKVAITQKLNSQVPLNLQFRDETGKSVTLGDYFGKRPAILAMVYYQCKMLCPEEIDGLVGTLKMVKFKPGKDFNLIFVSIDPTETPAIAARQKAVYVSRYGHPQTASGWHFLTGSQSSIDALAAATGYGYTRVPGPDGKMTQFAHASSIELLTPTGKLAQYYLGVEYSPKDIQLGLVDASHGRIGTPVDEILTYCYRYNPLLHRYSLLIARIVQAACLLTVVLLMIYLAINFRRDILNGRLASNKLATRKTANG